MRQQKGPTVKSKVDARQADTQTGSKRVLYISTALAIVVLLLALWWAT